MSEEDEDGEEVESELCRCGMTSDSDVVSCDNNGDLWGPGAGSEEDAGDAFDISDDVRKGSYVGSQLGMMHAHNLVESL